MLQTFPVRPNRARLIPAVAHLDDSARVQTLAQTNDPSLYELISTFAAATGVPMLCNTSLNDREEPIIDTAAQAVNFCLRKGITVLYLDDVRAELTNHHAYLASRPLTRHTAPFISAAAHLDNLENAI